MTANDPFRGFHHDDAACRTDGSESAVRAMHAVMFAAWNERGITARRRHAEALTYCDRCPARDACLAWALANPTLIGDHIYRPALSAVGRPSNTVGDIWGGKTVDERWRLRREAGNKARAINLGPIRHGTDSGVERHRQAGTPLCDRCAAHAGQANGHGTVSGWRRHGLDRTAVCDACAAWAGGAEHGTDAGWHLHRADGSRPCGDCALAHVRASTPPPLRADRPTRAQLEAAFAALA